MSESNMEKIASDPDTIVILETISAGFRFESKVYPEPNSGCWLWDGAMFGSGYGAFWFRGNNVGAHRFSYELHVGPIPKGMFVCHRCDVPACVNPGHLWLGTSSENTADKVAKGRAARGESHGSRTRPERIARGDRHGSRTKPERLARGDRNGTKTKPESRPRGETHGSAKLSDRQISEMHAARAAGAKLRELALSFGCSESHVSSVLRWKARFVDAVPGIAYAPAYGERHAGAKLTDAQVVEIRRRYRLGESCTEIAKDFTVVRPLQVRNVAMRRSRKVVSEVEPC